VESGVNQSNDEVLRSRVGGNVEKPTQELVEPVAPLYIIWYLGGPTEGVYSVWVACRAMPRSLEAQSVRSGERGCVRRHGLIMR
jgi:hypothetical protein